MTAIICTICRKPKATLICGICTESICKGCTQFLEPEQFAFRKILPEALKFSTYCGTCYNLTIEPALAAYEATLEKARQVSLFYKDQARETRRMSRIETPIRVEKCLDKNETILRLAFIAVEKDFNTLVDVDLVSTKVKKGNYQHSVWDGTAIPVRLESEKLKRK